MSFRTSTLLTACLLSGLFFAGSFAPSHADTSGTAAGPAPQSGGQWSPARSPAWVIPPRIIEA